MKKMDEKGYTLVELMTVVGISSILAFTLYAGLRGGDAQVESTDLKMEIQDSAREGLYKMLQEIRESSPTRITIGSGCTSITFNIPDPNSTVSVTTYTVNWPGHQIQYSRNASNQVTRSNSTLGTTSVLANDVTSVMFTTDTTAPFTCSTGSGTNISTVSVVENVQRTMKNGRVVPATALQLAGQARVRNS